MRYGAPLHAKASIAPKVISRSEVAWRDNGITTQWRATPRVPGDSCILRPRMGTGIYSASAAAFLSFSSLLWGD